MAMVLVKIYVKVISSLQSITETMMMDINDSSNHAVTCNFRSWNSTIKYVKSQVC
jgi:hypothetical protein